MSVKDRLNKALRELKYRGVVQNQTDFGDKLSYSKTYISRLFNEHEPLTGLIATEMETLFRLNKKWLLTGEGDVFIDKTNISDTTKDLEEKNISNKSGENHNIELNNGTVFAPSEGSRLNEKEGEMTIDRLMRIAENMSYSAKIDSETRKIAEENKRSLQTILERMMSQIEDQRYEVKKTGE